MDFEAGTTFDRYVIQGLLGEGGMGQVYRAFDVRLRRKVALKILRANKDASGASQQATVSMLREARAAAALDHPNAVAIFDLGEHDGIPFLAMELVQGTSLRAFIGRVQVSIEQRVRWLTEIGRALSAAHRAGIVHRDIKPENVMVREDSVVKVLDFGLAGRSTRPLGALREHPASPFETADLGLSERIMGTPPYMAPEQLRNEPLDGRTDQFSWGVVAYELLTGALPWKPGDSISDVIGAVLYEQPPRVRERNPGIPEAVAGVIERAMRKERDERFETMSDLLMSMGDTVSQDGARVDRTKLAAMAETLDVAEVVSSGAVPSSPFGRTSGVTEVPSSPFGRTSGVTEVPSSPFDRAVGLTEMLETTPKSAPSTHRSHTSAPVADAAPDAGQKSLDLMPPDADGEPVQEMSELDDGPTSNERATPPLARTAPPVLAPRRSVVPSRVAKRSPLRLFSVAAVATIAIALAWRWLPAASPVAPPAETTSVTAPPTVTALTALPPPRGCKADAVTEYERGIRAMHDGVWEQADQNFERATELDPNCAAALLRFVMTGYYNYPISRTRELYQRAALRRSDLSERDQLLLDALDPLVRSDPANLREYAKRLRELSDRFPGDAELARLASDHASEPSLRESLARRALAADPAYSDALQSLSKALHFQNKTDEAMASLDECVRIAQSSVDCVRERAKQLQVAGRCDEAVQTTRIWIARDPKTAEGYWWLANMLVSQGVSRESIDESLRQRWSRLPDPQRPDAQLIDEAIVDALYGDFQGAEQRARELLTRAANGADIETRGLPTLLLVDLLLETGRGEQAAEIAAKFVERMRAWSTNLASPGTDVVFLLLEPRLLDAAFRGGRMSASQLETARTAWARSLREAGLVINVGLVDQELLWAIGPPVSVRNEQEAKRSLEAMPSSLKVVDGAPRRRLAEHGAFAGRTLLLGGETEQAVIRLRDAASSCRAFYDPFVHTRAHLWLGEALEKKGDSKGACEAYRVVKERWGNASPRSVTAEKAAQRIAALRCEE